MAKLINRNSKESNKIITKRWHNWKRYFIVMLRTFEILALIYLVHSVK